MVKLYSPAPGSRFFLEVLDGPALRTVSEAGGRPYVARITGRDATYVWGRKFLGRVPRDSMAGRRGSDLVEMIVELAEMAPLPAALDARWGPCDSAPGGPGKCRERTWLVATEGEPWIALATEAQVAALVDRGAAPMPTRPRRHLPRARIDFDEEV